MLKIDFKSDSHEYFINGKKVPSVTQVLSLAGEFKYVNKDVLERAAKFGTAVHKATELYDQNNLNLDNLDPALMPYLQAWKKFLNETNFKILEIEKIVGSNRMGYAGTIDRIGYIGDDLTLLDIKTTTTIARTVPLQLGAYAAAWNENNPNFIKKRICVQLKPLKYIIKPYTNILDYQMFCNFLTVYKWSNNYE